MERINPFNNFNGFKEALVVRKPPVMPSSANAFPDASEMYEARILKAGLCDEQEKSKGVKAMDDGVKKFVSINPFHDILSFSSEINAKKAKAARIQEIRTKNPNPFVFFDEFSSILKKSIEHGKANGHKTENNGSRQAYGKEFYEMADAVPIQEVISEMGGYAKDDGQKYKVNGVNIAVDGMQWYDFNGEEGGVGAISLVAHLRDEERKDAAQWLKQKFGARFGSFSYDSYSSGEKEKFVYEPPVNAPEYTDNIRKYLSEKRAIPLELVNRMIKEGRVYADNFKNVVMISKIGEIAELRGTEPYMLEGKWRETKKLKPGSDKRTGAFMVTVDASKIRLGLVKSAQKMAFTEAGMDALSYHALNPDTFVGSASGVGIGYAREIFFQGLDNGWTFITAFDNDLAGRRASQGIYNSAVVYDYLNSKGWVENPEQMIDLFLDKTVKLSFKSPKNSGSNDHDDGDDYDAYGGSHENEGKDLEEIDEKDIEDMFFYASHEPFAPGKEPVVRFIIKENNLGMPVGPVEIKIPREYHNKIISKFRLKHDIPPEPAKDWNDVLTRNMKVTKPKFLRTGS